MKDFSGINSFSFWQILNKMSKNIETAQVELQG